MSDTVRTSDIQCNLVSIAQANDSIVLHVERKNIVTSNGAELFQIVQ